MVSSQNGHRPSHSFFRLGQLLGCYILLGPGFPFSGWCPPAYGELRACLKPGAAGVRRKRRKAHHPQILLPPKLLGMQVAGGIALVSPRFLAMAWFILEPELLWDPLPCIPSGSYRCLPSCPIMGFAGVLMPGDAMGCSAGIILLLPPSSCFPLPKDGFRMNFPNTFKRLHKSPSPAGSWCSC